MGPRPRLMVLAGTAAATLGLAIPDLAQGAAGATSGAAAMPTYEYSAPLTERRDLRADGDTAPSEQSTPPPAPSGCPFRDGKLELIV
jgi:hypothetical protein